VLRQLELKKNAIYRNETWVYEDNLRDDDATAVMVTDTRTPLNMNENGKLKTVALTMHSPQSAGRNRVRTRITRMLV